jgi:hypothetical protein
MRWYKIALYGEILIETEGPPRGSQKRITRDAGKPAGVGAVLHEVSVN